MARGPTHLDDSLYSYLLSVGVREPPILAELREETTRHSRASCQISVDQGAFMALLVQATCARRTIEVGVFTGYSSIAVALALPPEGRVIACDVSEEFTAVARAYWKKAGVDHKIELRLAPATETLDALLSAGEEGSFDFAFIDADKSSYDAYYERLLRLIRPGGLIAIDNVLWSGKVADAAISDADTIALRALNQKLRGDERISLSLVPIADGLTLALKR